MTAIELMNRPYARMVLPDGEGTYFAEIIEFPGCFATGETSQEALSNLESVAVDWINTVIGQGQDIPEPMETAGYSGKLVLRMPKSLHKRASLYADRDGASLNQFIVSCLAERVGNRATGVSAANYSFNAVFMTVGRPTLGKNASILDMKTVTQAQFAPIWNAPIGIKMGETINNA